jgi:hypothetical protein
MLVPRPTLNVYFISTPTPGNYNTVYFYPVLVSFYQNNLILEFYSM